jgi:hypothetical protein
MRGIFIIGLSSILLAGCATGSSEIAEAYVSPIQYQSYSCTQLDASKNLAACGVF